MANNIIVKLGIDSASYQDEKTVNLSRYATEVGKLVRHSHPELSFKFSAFEDDNAETTIEFPNDIDSKTRSAVESDVQDAEGKIYSDEDVWN